MQPSHVGGAPELLQARCRKDLKLPDVPVPVSLETVNGEASVPEVKAVEKLEPTPAPPESTLSLPEAAALETLPNRDLDELCRIHLGKFDRRWSRDSKIRRLLEAGFQGRVVPPPSPGRTNKA